METTINHRLLSWNPETQTLSTEASDLQLRSTPPEITVVGRHDAVAYRLAKTLGNGEEILGWEYRPTAASIIAVPAAKGTRLVIFND